MKNKHKKGLTILLCTLLVLIVLITSVLGVLVGYGPFHFLRGKMTSSLPGNAEQYSFEKIELLEGNPFEEKNICVLGSSVVYGYASQENSIPEYFARRFGCTFTKSAVSGTTLVDTGVLGYVTRLKRLNPSDHYDLFICQLSTNDATKGKPLGVISSGADYDTATITGAMEFIINYARDAWGCPVVFFTGSHYESEAYDAMVRRLHELQDKYAIGVLDLWNGDEFNNIPDELRAVYMSDDIHPTKAGYRDWWGPELERQLLEYMAVYLNEHP